MFGSCATCQKAHSMQDFFGSRQQLTAAADFYGHPADQGFFVSSRVSHPAAQGSVHDCSIDLKLSVDLAQHKGKF